MSKKQNPSIDDQLLFKEAVKGVKKIVQDTVVMPPNSTRLPQKIHKRSHAEQNNAIFYFSDVYQPLLKQDPVSYLREGAAPALLKALRQEHFPVELLLDLHGLNQKAAKQALSLLLATCLKERIACACVVFGHGKHILKKHVPFWLAQHPQIIALHQAPQRYGGNAALLILMDIDQQTL